MSGQSTAAKLAAARRRIAGLEAELAKVTQHAADLEATFRTLHGMHQAQKPGEPLKRDPASSTSLQTRGASVRDRAAEDRVRPARRLRRRRQCRRGCPRRTMEGRP